MNFLPSTPVFRDGEGRDAPCTHPRAEPPTVTTFTCKCDILITGSVHWTVTLLAFDNTHCSAVACWVISNTTAQGFSSQPNAYFLGSHFKFKEMKREDKERQNRFIYFFNLCLVFITVPWLAASLIIGSAASSTEVTAFGSIKTHKDNRKCRSWAGKAAAAFVSLSLLREKEKLTLTASLLSSIDLRLLWCPQSVADNYRYYYICIDFFRRAQRLKAIKKNYSSEVGQLKCPWVLLGDTCLDCQSVTMFSLGSF